MERLNPRSPELEAALQDLRQGTKTNIEYLTLEEIIEKYGDKFPVEVDKLRKILNG